MHLKNMKSIGILIVGLFSLLFLYTHEACSEEAQSSSTKPGFKIKTVYVDPAYGGQEEGPQLAQALNGKTITLLLAYKLQASLQTAGFTVYLSRDNDVFVPLDRRVVDSQSKGADIYVRLKLSKLTRDCITIVTSAVPRKEAHQVKQTAKTDRPDRKLEEILKDLIVDHKLKESVRIAQMIKAKTENFDFAHPVRIDNVYDYILLNTEMPIVTVDLGIAKAETSPYILDPDKQDAIADAIASAVTEYAQKKSDAQ